MDVDYSTERRREINAVMKAVGREQFWDWIVDKLEDKFGDDLNYNRAVDIQKRMSSCQKN